MQKLRWLALFVFTSISQLGGQSVSQISGTITDASGAAVPAAQVSVINVDTAALRSAETGTDGVFTFTNLVAGPYRLQVKKDGFGVYNQTGIVLQVNTHPSINVTLQVGAVSTQVEVQSDANMLETQNSSVGQVIDQRRVVELPLNGRNITQLIVLSGGAVAATGGASVGNITASQLNYPNVAVFSVGGGAANATNYTLDGAAHVDIRSNVGFPYPFPDAVQEFKVETSSLPASYGSHPGGAVSAITKSGTNAIHGDLFEFLRNGAMNARNFFAPTRDSLKRNQFGATLGGPILRDRLFFFGGFQGTTERTAPATVISFVPTAAVLQGDFRTILAPPCQAKQVNLLASTGAVNNVLPASTLHPIALKILKMVPVSDDPCGKLQYGVPTVNNEYQGVGKIDWQRTPKDSLFFRFFTTDYAHPYNFTGNLLTVATTYQELADRVSSFTLGHTYLISPAVVNALRLTYSRSATVIPAPDGVPKFSELGMKVYQPTRYIGQLAVSNYFPSIGIFPSHIFNNNYGLSDDLDINRGSHHMTMGFSWQRIEMNSDIPSFTSGRMTFSGTNTGNALASFMTGIMETWLQGTDQVGRELENLPALYFQDNWRVNSRFQVNVGLRWDPFLPQKQRWGILSAFDPAALAAKQTSKVFVNAPPGLIFPGDEGFPGQSDTFPRYANFEPRFGFTFDPRGKGTETIRGGYGIFYDSNFLFITQQVNLNSPWASVITFPGAINMTDPWANYPGGNPFPWPSPPPKNIAFPAGGKYNFMPLHAHLPYVQQWNLAVQKQFAKDWLVSASYLGNKTTHQWQGHNINPAIFVPGNCVAGQYGLTAPGPCSTIANEPSRFPNQGYGIMGVLDDAGNASYNGLLLSLNHRFSHNFSALANYTWSHCLNQGDGSADIGSRYQDPFNRKAEWGNCAVDRRNVINLSLVAHSPGIGTSWIKRISNNWQVSGIYSYLAGPWVSVLTGTDVSLTGIGLDRPNVVGDSRVENPSTAQWFNTAAFVKQAAGTYGNSRRNNILGPSAWNMDLGLWRSFPVMERAKLDVRFEAFNILNHTRFNIPVVSLNAGNFGQITTAKDPRILQVAMKFSF